MNDIKASLAFGAGLILLGLWLIRWHRQTWKENDRAEAPDDRSRRHYRTQFRRRVQISGLLVLLGVMIPLGDWLMVQRKNPQTIAIFWMMVLAITFWIMLLALVDWLLTRMHVRATRAALSGLARQQRELEAEVDRLRKSQSNGRH